MKNTTKKVTVTISKKVKKTLIQSEIFSKLKQLGLNFFSIAIDLGTCMKTFLFDFDGTICVERSDNALMSIFC